jgi:hypothetical protein
MRNPEDTRSCRPAQGPVKISTTQPTDLAKDLFWRDDPGRGLEAAKVGVSCDALDPLHRLRESRRCATWRLVHEAVLRVALHHLHWHPHPELLVATVVDDDVGAGVGCGICHRQARSGYRAFGTSDPHQTVG